MNTKLNDWELCQRKNKILYDPWINPLLNGKEAHNTRRITQHELFSKQAPGLYCFRQLQLLEHLCLHFPTTGRDTKWEQLQLPHALNC